MNTAARVLVGMAVAAGAVYLLDPASGRRRRFTLGDEFTRATRRMEIGTRGARHDTSERAHAVAAWTKSKLTPDQTRDKAVLKHVRETIRDWVSDARSISVAVDEGQVILRGSVYTHEHQRLLDELRRVPGVRIVTDHLTAREMADSLSWLDAGHDFRSATGPGGWTIAGRVLATGAGCALLAWGVKERRTLGEYGSSIGQKLWRAGKEEFQKGLHAAEGAIDNAQEIAEDTAAKARDTFERADASARANIAEYTQAQSRRRQGESGADSHV